MSTKLENWIELELARPKRAGDGRNNQMIRLAPRMLELGWDEHTILARFKASYSLNDDSSKDEEIWRVIRNAAKYARFGDQATQRSSNAGGKRRAAIKCSARRELRSALSLHPWSFEEVRSLGWCDMPPAEQRCEFLRTMFRPDDIIWCGGKFDSGKPKHAVHFRSVNEWLGQRAAPQFVSHCTFQRDSFSRSNAKVKDRRFLVVESDVLDHDEILSLFRWLENDRQLRLRAAVFSGKRSIHGWFDWPENEVRELSAFIEGLNCDPATLRASQPVRLAGARRPDTGRIQELLYLAR